VCVNDVGDRVEVENPGGRRRIAEKITRRRRNTAVNSDSAISDTTSKNP